ncbi:hypothetical protein BH10ACT1_BH10ACT1_13630 [soil metagenome]
MTDHLDARAGTDFDRSGTTLTVYLSGDLDLVTSPAVHEQVSGQLAGVRRLVVNLSEVTFCDSVGVRLFAMLHEELAAAGATLVLQDPTRMMRRLLDITGLAAVLPVHGVA